MYGVHLFIEWAVVTLLSRTGMALLLADFLSILGVNQS